MAFDVEIGTAARMAIRTIQPCQAECGAHPPPRPAYCAEAVVVTGAASAAAEVSAPSFIADGEEQIGLIGQPADIRRADHSGDAQLRAGMALIVDFARRAMAIAILPSSAVVTS